MNKIRLGVNIDHVATIRNARGGVFPCPIEAAKIAKKAGADGITAHLREDRRHIKDWDIFRLKNEVDLPLNFEMAATNEMLAIALKVKPNAVCLVPEKRTELTTEGGLNIVDQVNKLQLFTKKLQDAQIRVSLFVDPDISQIKAAKEVGVDIVELHTGKYCEMSQKEQKSIEFDNLQKAAQLAQKLQIECHGGHGLNCQSAQEISKISQIIELNIGHFLISEAIFVGLENAIVTMKNFIRR